MPYQCAFKEPVINSSSSESRPEKNSGTDVATSTPPIRGQQTLLSADKPLIQVDLSPQHRMRVELKTMLREQAALNVRGTLVPIPHTQPCSSYICTFCPPAFRHAIPPSS
jgi:hypothetical protein